MWGCGGAAVAARPAQAGAQEDVRAGAPHEHGARHVPGPRWAWLSRRARPRHSWRWARCVRHVLIFTDPSSTYQYVSDRRYVYLSAGDAWRRRPYLPMTHMEALGRLISKPGSPSSEVSWFFMVTDRTFVDVRALLHALRGLDPSRKGYWPSQLTHKEAFGPRLRRPEHRRAAVCRVAEAHCRIAECPTKSPAVRSTCSTQNWATASSISVPRPGATGFRE